MKNINLGMLFSWLLLAANSAYADTKTIKQSLLSLENVTHVASCFEEQRSTYQGFINSTVKDYKSHYGQMARNVSAHTLSHSLSEQKYQMLKDKLECLLVNYQSGGEAVEGFIIATKNLSKPLPLVVFNRGGNGGFGKLTVLQMLRQLPLVKQGAIIVGSQYREQDEFGGKDIDDVHQIIDIAKQLPHVTAGKIDMVGVSRGGMTSYMVARERSDIDSLVIWAGNSDLEKGLTIRPEMERVYTNRIPNYQAEKTQQLYKRSAIKWVEELTSDIRILLLHGDKDKRVNVIHAKDMASRLAELNREHKLVIYPGGDHGLKREQTKVYQEIASWIFK